MIYNVFEEEALVTTRGYGAEGGQDNDTPPCDSIFTRLRFAITRIFNYQIAIDRR